MTFNTWRPWAVFLPSGNLVVNMFEIYLTEVKKMWVLNRICEEKNRYFKKTTVGSEQLSELFSYKYSRTSSIWISTVPDDLPDTITCGIPFEILCIIKYNAILSNGKSFNKKVELINVKIILEWIKYMKQFLPVLKMLRTIDKEV